MRDLSYPDRLKKLKMPTLRYRRMRGDMIETFKILSGIYDSRVTGGLFERVTSSYTRGHDLKIAKKRSSLDVRKNFFTNRVVDLWNSLPNNIISAKNVKTFENRLDRYWENHPMYFNHETDYCALKVHQPGKKSTEVEPNTEEPAMLLLSEQT